MAALVAPGGGTGSEKSELRPRPEAANRSEWRLSVCETESDTGTRALNIISRQHATRPDTGAIGSELARLLREDALDLPELPDIAVRVASLSGSAPVRARDLADIAAGDERSQRSLMQVGRQAACEPGLALDTPRDVIGWIGPAEAADIIYTASLQDVLLRDTPQAAPARRLWQANIAAAIWSREAAALARRRSKLTYACGLLHDIGKSVTALACGPIAARLGDALDDAGTADLVSEYHEIVAERVARRWQLPHAVARCIRGWRDGRDAGPDERELPVVYLGHHLAELVAEQGPEFAREALAADRVLDLLNIGPDRFRGLVDRAAWVTRQVEAY